MKRSLVLLIAATLLFLSCAKSTPEVAAGPVERKTIAIEYVGIPKMNVYSAPKADASVVTTYGMGETVSILARQGEWSEIRTVEGSGWVRQADLMSAEQAKAMDDNPVPRFMNPPAPVVNKSLQGEITLVATVSPDGSVIQARIVNNTTGDNALAIANANNLMKATFYPMVKKGQRMGFNYEHKVYYPTPAASTTTQ